jgi:Domain of unknown function (DUF6989)
MKSLPSITAEDKLIMASLLCTFGGIILGALLREPRAYGITAILVILILIVGTYLTRSPRLSWLLVFGFTAGVLELWADWIHVASLHSLVYTDYFGLKLLESPSYMPIGWWLTCVQFGYIALRLSEKWSNGRVVGMISIMGMLLPPWYEEFAKPARAWYYTTSHLLISNTPVWIILTYGGCMFGIAMMTLLCYSPHQWGRAIVGGVFTAASFMLSAVFWYTLLG